MHQTFLDSVSMILSRLSQRSQSTSHAPIPTPLSPKFKGESSDYSLDEFKSKLHMTFERFEESLSSNRD